METGDGVGLDTDADARVALGVQVNNKGAVSLIGQGRPKVKGGGGFPRTALLVDDRHDVGHDRHSGRLPAALFSNFFVMIKYRRKPVKDYLAGVARTIFAQLFHEMAQPLQTTLMWL